MNRLLGFGLGIAREGSWEKVSRENLEGRWLEKLLVMIAPCCAHDVSNKKAVRPDSEAPHSTDPAPDYHNDGGRVERVSTRSRRMRREQRLP